MSSIDMPKPWWRRSQRENDLERELQSDLELEAAEQRAKGLPPGEADAAARRALGNAVRVKEDVRRSWGWASLGTFGQDFRYALRLLRKSPAFTSVALLSLALGIGANTAIFSVIYAVLLRPLPYPEPSQLTLLGQSSQQYATTIPEYDFWKRHATTLSSIAGFRGVSEYSMTSGAGKEWITALTVTSDFLRTLGVNPALGREFNSEETHPGGPQAIILTDGLWHKSFGSDPNVLGRVVTLENGSYIVVGVLPRGFWCPETSDALIPLRSTGSLADMGMNTEVFGRLKNGVSIREARAEMAAPSEDFRRETHDKKYRGLTVFPFQDTLVQDVRVTLLLLFGATALLLLIACSNLAGLLLTRLAVRRKELAVRLALGGSRGRLLRQFWVENMILAGAGALAGIFCAWALLRGLVALMPFELPLSSPIRLNGPVLLFTLACTAFMALFFTFVPAISAASLKVSEALKAGARSSGAVRQQTRNLLVVGEVALSGMLLIAAALMIQSLYRLHQERLGFQPHGLITFNTPIAREHAKDAAQLTRYIDLLLERLRASPGVRSFAASNALPLSGPGNIPTQREGHPADSIGAMEIRLVSPAYFETMGIPVRLGRSFTAHDNASAPLVALANEALARSWWPTGNPLGDRIVIGRYQTEEYFKDPPREIIGVVGDSKTLFIKEPARPTVFLPVAQTSDSLAGAGSQYWIVKTNGSSGIEDEIRRAIAPLDSTQRIKDFRTMDSIVESTSASSRFDAWLFGGFAAIALLLAAIGVFGVLAYSVAQRRQEIGTRIALGASRSNILALILKQGLALTAIGLAIGTAGAFYLTHFLSSLLFGVKRDSPAVFAAVSLLLLAVSLIASYIPARRAIQIDPMDALRNE